MHFSRDDDSLLAGWWFTIDRLMLGLVLSLYAVGLVVSLAASPSVAMKKELAPFHFVERHLVFAAIGVVAMLVISALSPRGIRRLALALYIGGLAGMVAVLAIGPEINGATRWLRLGGLSVQPSEFAKPGLVVLAAWALAEWQKRRDVPALPIAVGLLAAYVGLLAAQPDVGQAVLITGVWLVLIVLAGLPLTWTAAIAAAGTVGLSLAYVQLDYVRGRIDTFLSGGARPGSQVGRATQSFVDGGFFGRGPGEGQIKTVLPDAHTDFIFAVLAEEYGVLACLGLLGLYALIVFRAIGRAIGEHDLASRFALIGLGILFGMQAAINMGVNVGLLPATGMTLPLISYGGSSLLAISVTLGMMLALGRRRPGVAT